LLGFLGGDKNKEIELFSTKFIISPMYAPSFHKTRFRKVKMQQRSPLWMVASRGWWHCCFLSNRFGRKGRKAAADIADSARTKLDDAEGCPSFIGGHPDFEVRAGGGVAETGCPFISRRIAAQKTHYSTLTIA
jgi:hypothetical protein